MGYGATVFEALPVLGGMLRVGIPEYRLPKKVLGQEIDQILELVKVEVNARLGNGLSLDDVKEYQAVFLAWGTTEQEPGFQARGQGVMSGSSSSGREPGKKIELERVAVIGIRRSTPGGPRLGAKPLILYRRTREEMPAFAGEVHEAEEEGIEISLLTSPLRVISQDGRVTQLECVKNRLGPPDEDGRRRPVEIKGSNYTVEVDQIISAIGEEADLASLPKKLGVKDNIVPTDGRGRRSRLESSPGDVILQPYRGPPSPQGRAASSSTLT
jgi:NADPH-dependent glutamate synthase beta subunit-like oxidoreductase